MLVTAPISLYLLKLSLCFVIIINQLKLVILH